MTGQDLYDIRTSERLGYWTQRDCAALIGVTARAWRHWELGKRTIPEPVSRLVRLAYKLPEVRRALQKMAQETCR